MQTGANLSHLQHVINERENVLNSLILGDVRHQIDEALGTLHLLFLQHRLFILFAILIVRDKVEVLLLNHAAPEKQHRIDQLRPSRHRINASFLLQIRFPIGFGSPHFNGLHMQLAGRCDHVLYKNSVTTPNMAATNEHFDAHQQPLCQYLHEPTDRPLYPFRKKLKQGNCNWHSPSI